MKTGTAVFSFFEGSLWGEETAAKKGVLPGGRCCSTWRSTQKRHGAADEDAGSPGPTGKQNLASRVITNYYQPWGLEYHLSIYRD